MAYAGRFIRFAESRTGYLGFVLALAYAPTRLVQEANPEWRLVSWALAIEVIGFAILALDCFFRSDSGSGLPRARVSGCAFPLLFFLLSVPWPTIIEGPLIRGLTAANARATAELLGLVGIPAVAHGNVIETGAGLVGIDEACSGIRSIQACLMIAIFFGEVYNLCFQSRLLCAAGGLFSALWFNALRTTLLSVIVASKGPQALASWHDSAGLTVLLSCFTATWLFAQYLRKRETGGESPHKQEHLAGVRERPHWPRPPAGWRMSLALACWIALTELGTELWYRVHERSLAEPVRWHIEPPTGRNGQGNRRLSETSRQFLRFDAALNAVWEDPAGLRWQAIFLEWNPGRIAARLARNHTPEDCLTAAGRAPVKDPVLHFISVQGLDLPFRFYSANDQSGPFHVFYCLWEDRAVGHSFNGELLSYRNRLASVAAGRRNSGQRSLELALWGAADDREAELALRGLLPAIIKMEN